jgi:hypothetical protein
MSNRKASHLRPSGRAASVFQEKFNDAAVIRRKKFVGIEAGMCMKTKEAATKCLRR